MLVAWGAENHTPHRARGAFRKSMNKQRLWVAGFVVSRLWVPLGSGGRTGLAVREPKSLLRQKQKGPLVLLIRMVV